jgi:riboflavin biosynthesis pyrimidine reductase
MKPKVIIHSAVSIDGRIDGSWQAGLVAVLGWIVAQVAFALDRRSSALRVGRR